MNEDSIELNYSNPDAWDYSDIGHHWRKDDTGNYHDWPCDFPEEHINQPSKDCDAQINNSRSTRD